jgi:LPS O-antigen subunit length determinant protein (WzzB/FepE family)
MFSEKGNDEIRTKNSKVSTDRQARKNQRQSKVDSLNSSVFLAEKENPKNSKTIFDSLDNHEN